MLTEKHQQGAIKPDEARSHEVITKDYAVDLSILIVGYNSIEYLDECMSSISRAINQYSYEILFVNNGTDHSEEFVRKQHPQAKILPSLGNVGFAAGNNYLAKYSGGRWLLLLNPDTTLYPNALDILLDNALRHPEYQVLGGTTVAADGSPHLAANIVLPSFGSILRGLIGKAAREIEFTAGNNLLELDAVTGGFMLVERDCWMEMGGLDESYFLYAEELDFFKRLKVNGGRVAQISDSLIYHDTGSGDIYSPNRVRFQMTGNAHYMHKHFSKPYAYACISLLWFASLVRYGGSRVLASKNEKYARMSRGLAPVVRAPWRWMQGYRSRGADPRKN